MGPITEVTLVGGERHGVEGDVREVERRILDAARGSLMQLAWLTDARTAQPLGINPEHVLTLRGLEASDRPAAPPDAADPR